MPPSESEARDFSARRADAVVIATVTELPDGERVCTISPPPTTERAVLEEWVGATADSFVRLDEMR
ncbi:MAG: hypothetical protein ACLFNC_01185 [Halodesulfurarchaeum sp.]